MATKYNERSHGHWTQPFPHSFQTWRVNDTIWMQLGDLKGKFRLVLSESEFAAMNKAWNERGYSFDGNGQWVMPGDK